MKPQNKAEIEVTPFAIALYQFNGRAEDELSFNANDIILLIKHIDDKWTEGELDGKSGIFPTSFVTIEVDCPNAFTVNQKTNSIQPNSRLETCTNRKLGNVEDVIYQNTSSNNCSGNLAKLMKPETVLPQLQNPLPRLQAPIKPIPKRPAPAPPQTTNAVRFGKESTIPESNNSQHYMNIPRNTELSKLDHTASTQWSRDVKVVRPRIPRNKCASDVSSLESVANSVKDFPRLNFHSLGNTAGIEKEGDHFIPTPAPRTSLLKDKDNAKVSKPPKLMSRNQARTAIESIQEGNAHLISPATKKTKPFIDLTGLSKEPQALTVTRKSELMPTVSETSDHHFYSEIDTDIDSHYASIDTLDYRKPKTGQGFIGQMSTNDLSAENSANRPRNVPESDKIHIRSPANALTVSLSAVKVTAGAKNDSVRSNSNIKPIISTSQVKEPSTSQASKSQFYVPLLSNETSSADLKYANISTESPISKSYPNELYDSYPHLVAKTDQHHADIENVYEDMTQFKPNSICDKTEYEVMSKVKPNSIHTQSSPPSLPPSIPPKKRSSSINLPFIPLPQH